MSTVKPKLSKPLRLPPGSSEAQRKRRVTPRDAASLILKRGGDGGAAGAEVLMGQRAGKHKFMPGAYVFPGGKVDGHDAQVQPASRLSDEAMRHLTRAASPLRAGAIGKTAIRETYEETGLLLAAPGDLGEPSDATWAEVKGMGLAPDLRHLDYLGRAITPPGSPIRFHARFLVADARHMRGELGGSGELLNLHWIAIDEALHLPIADVTEFMLIELKRFLEGDADVRRKRPLFSYRNNRAFATYS
jgi:8-oxo-dGTP pyrophosphatase MutT (NUDIX family)